MNFFLLSLILMIGGGTGFWFLGAANIVSQNASAFLAVVSVMAAGVLVRLNRGVPSVDWKSVSNDSLTKLLGRLEEIAKAYIAVFLLALFAIALIISGMLLGSTEIPYRDLILKLIASTFGTCLGLLISRMCYIIWLDLDIVRLQNAVILSAAAEKDGVEQKAVAEDKLRAMRQTRVVPL